MSQRTHHVLFTVFLALCVPCVVAGCGEEEKSVKETVEEKAEAIKEDIDSAIEDAIQDLEAAVAQSQECEDILEASVREGEGYGVPGVAEAPRWGIPEETSNELRVRRSYSSLSDAEKKQVIDAFVKLKQTTVDSGSPGAERADYETFCEGDYTRNLYDYYVELHLSAFVSMGKDDMPHERMAHMGPQFLPWHRYLLLRLEADMQQVLGDPDFALPYWDWEDCENGEGDGSNPCSKIFDTEFIGSHGSCTDGEKDVTGYLVDQGFAVNIYSDAEFETVFNIDSLRCASKSLQRAVGCSETTDGEVPTAEDAAAIFERKIYDVEPYDTCSTDENVSMRQYLEGYSKSEDRTLCIITGCENHGLGHVYIGGDMGSGGAPTNDPMFFLHHANVDRLWAMWQDRNRQAEDTADNYGNPGYPEDWNGQVFNFDEVRADEMFDFRALGFTYDTNTQ